MMPSSPREQNWPEFSKRMGAFIMRNTQLAAPPLVPEISLYLANDVTPLWKATEEFLQKQNIPAPFWCFAWPGGQALARYILDNPESVRGKRVLDFASGSGLVAIAAKISGALSVTANDVDPLAIVSIGLNATHNKAALNVLHDNLVGKNLPDYDVLLAGDFCYEWPMAGYAVEWLRGQVAQGRRVLFADPGRPHAPRTGLQELARYAVATTTAVEDSDVKSTGVFNLLPSEED